MEARYFAAWALGEIKPSDPQIHLALAELLKDTHVEARYFAAWALGEIKPSDPQILLALNSAASNDTNERVRRSAAEALNTD